MPLPLAPLIPLAVRLGLVATTSFAVTRWVRSATHPGRTDQRAEDAFDDLDEGLAAHVPADREGQRNAALRVKRVVGWGGRKVELDLGMLARVRVRGVAE